MQIVIDIPEEEYNIIKKFNAPMTWAEHLIATGTPLPKGHGKLKDFEKIYVDMKEKEELARQMVIDAPTNSYCYMRYVAKLNERTAFKEMLYNAPTIIEADTESEVPDAK